MITLSHGSGGKAMRNLIKDVFVKHFDNPELKKLEDQARIDLNRLNSRGDRLAFATDSYVVDPLFFSGGDIGKLAVTGTVNDLAVGGATPFFLSCGMIIEEGLPISDLERIVKSMKQTADIAGVEIVAGDTKVVPRGSCDKMFINTSGIGVIPVGINIGSELCKPGDVVLCNGFLGDHGAAIVDARGDLALENSIQSDCTPLNSLIHDMLQCCPQIRCMRDATRGGVATVLNEFALDSRCTIKLLESELKVRSEVRGMCEILGLDPLYLANEGKIIVIVPFDQAENLLATMKTHNTGVDSCIIGRVTEASSGRVVLTTQFGGERLIDLLTGEQLPRIC